MEHRMRQALWMVMCIASMVAAQELSPDVVIPTDPITAMELDNPIPAPESAPMGVSAMPVEQVASLGEDPIPVQEASGTETIPSTEQATADVPQAPATTIEVQGELAAQTPAPPPPFTCFPPLAPSGIQCGNLSVLAFLTVRDNGDGTCVAIFSVANTQRILNCNAPAFPITPCNAVNVAVTLVFSRQNAAVPYQQRMATFLTSLGINSATIFTRPLTIYVDHTPNPFPGKFAPALLNNLRQVGALVIKECANCFANPDVGAVTPVLAALPTLIRLERFRDFSPGAAFLGSFIMTGTAFTDLRSFAGLRCPPGFFQITNNRLLTSFAGFNGLSFPTWQPGTTFYATGNSLLNAPAVQAISVMAGCPLGSSSPQTSRVFISTLSCQLPCWRSYCTYVNTNACTSCPAPPPPPATRPPPPPPLACLTPYRPTPVCGMPNDAIEIRDFGNGTAGAVVVKNGTFSTVNIGTNLFPGPACQTYLGSITLTAAYASNSTPYVPPAFQTWLSQLGVGLLQSIGGTLTLNVDHFPNPIPVVLNPSFLPTLQSSGTIIVAECANCRASPSIGPTNPKLASLPGMVGLKSLTGVLSGGSLTIQSTAFASLASFAGLICTPSLLSVNSNPFLSSIVTLGSLPPTPANSQGPQLQIANPQLTTQAQLAPLAAIAGCNNGTATLYGSISVTVLQTCNLQTFGLLCMFITTGMCPFSPPPPPLPPSPPPLALGATTLEESAAVPLPAPTAFSSINGLTASPMGAVDASESQPEGIPQALLDSASAMSG